MHASQRFSPSQPKKNGHTSSWGVSILVLAVAKTVELASRWGVSDMVHTVLRAVEAFEHSWH
jgi:hypothetical protein